MIAIAHGNLLEAPVEALVNTVNTKGVMGRGVALQFKQAYPANYRAYKRACDRGLVQLGKVFVFENGGIAGPRYIINFPTKAHWRARSKLEDIESGLSDLVRVVEEAGIKSIAIPPLGCGNGGLAWEDVRPRIEQAFASLPEVEVMLFPPEGAPVPGAMPVRTERPRMTLGRAAVIGVLARYGTLGLGVSRLEIQKLMYLLQAAGEPLRLNFEKQKFGPYAENLQHVLQAMEGHHLRGYGDRSAPSPIHVLPGAHAEAEAFLAKQHPETLGRFEAVSRLIDGFESPYGLELLTTVHWVTSNGEADAEDPVSVVAAVQAWSKRKKRLFVDHHIQVAWQRLVDEGWISTSP